MKDEKYIELLLEKCLDLKRGTPLFISYNKIIKNFVNLLTEYAKNMGITDIYLDEIDSYYVHDLLKNTSKEKIKDLDYFNASIWDEYAKKDAAFLMIESEIPNLMSDIESGKVEESALIKRSTKPLYKKKQLENRLAWCIAAYPNELWAKDIYQSDNSYEEFCNDLNKICMLDTDNPIKAWQDFLDRQSTVVKKLNDLKIKKLHYQNSLGTDLVLELNENTLWQSAASGKYLVNIPSYEVFTTPNYEKTEGIVYSSKPLNYGGKVIDNFYLKFKNGKVEEYDAEKGKDVLKEIIESDKYSAYLGECALVDFNSPISNTNKTFGTTLIDENASCHLALGSGFAECIKGGLKMDEKELFRNGINISKNHVDFMVGTSDFSIVATTDNGEVTIMKEGNLTI